MDKAASAITNTTAESAAPPRKKAAIIDREEIERIVINTSAANRHAIKAMIEIGETVGLGIEMVVKTMTSIKRREGGLRGARQEEGRIGA